MTPLLLPGLIAGLTGLAVVTAALLVVALRDATAVRRSLALVATSYTGTDPDEVSAGTPHGIRVPALVRASAAHLITARHRAWLARQLARAGRLDAGALDHANEARLATVAVGLLIGLLIGARMGGAAWLLLPVMVVAGYAAPDVVVHNAGLRRSEQIRLSLPDAIDLLDMCVEAGLSLQAAMAKVAEVQSGPVAAEFARVLQEMRLGVSRADALRALGDRATQVDLRQLVSAILQAETLGIPVASVLREQAREMRAKRRSRAREKAQKVPVKILAPLMLCFLPGLFIIILGPALITVVQVFASR